MLKTKISLNWIRSVNILAVSPAPASGVPDNRPLYDKLLFLDISSDLPGRDSNRRVSVERCKPCRIPDETNEMLKYLPSDLTKYVLNFFTT